MKKLLLLAGLLLIGPRWAMAFNPVTDVQDKLIWTLGEQASIGTAYKLAGGGPIGNGQRGDSIMFGIFDYRFLKESYGAISDPQNGQKVGDGLKTGLQLNYFLGWFKSPQTDAMKLLNNINIGPVYTVPLLTGPAPFKGGAFWLECNYQFGK
jgi:hypothetical protein